MPSPSKTAAPSSASACSPTPAKDVNGHSLTFELAELDSIAELDTSLMPPGLALSLTDRELSDLVAFLMTSEGKMKGE